MRRAISLAGLVLLLLACSSFVMAQISDVYWVSYYSNRAHTTGALDQTVRIVNPGEQGSPLSGTHGNICADIYVFDSNQEMIECCACKFSANALLTLSVNHDLTQNPLQGFPPPTDGVIKIISDNQANCDATSPVPVPDIRAWATHLQNPNGTLVVTEDEFLNAPLQQDELSFLGQSCSFVLFLGSGKGSCDCNSGG